MAKDKPAKKKGRKTETDNELLKSLKVVDGKYIFPLEDPIKHGNTTLDQFELAIPKAKHLRGLSADPDMDEILIIVGKLAGQPDSIIDELSMGDTNKVVEYFSSFG